MANKRAPKVAAFPAPWPPGTTCKFVVGFAAQRVPEFLLLYAAAYDKQNAVHMAENIKLLRGVVTKLDQFRRMKVREWKKAGGTNQTTGEHKP